MLTRLRSPPLTPRIWEERRRSAVETVGANDDGGCGGWAETD